eukprot:TRINITY_DN30854_c0_g1_i2.p1 TRINITY_DN30854_c0_g1~~TRINITY_DN30854_c0_g1_i2.p1  ORF type:complete len:343 (+),score=69.60 TRINITY_DN30854_c0_g1_i2:109-1137(+)
MMSGTAGTVTHFKGKEKQSQKRERFKCNEWRCDKSFSRQDSLEIHKRMHDGNGDYLCLICKETFPAYCMLICHQEKEHTNCSVCDRKFTAASALVLHEIAHTGEKPYTCNVCQEHFATLSAVIKHEAKMHTTADQDKPYYCVACGKRFGAKRNLQRHKKTCSIYPFSILHKYLFEYESEEENGLDTEGAEQCYDSSVDETETANETGEQINPGGTGQQSNIVIENVNYSDAGHGNVNDGVDSKTNGQLNKSELCMTDNAHGSNEDAVERTDQFLGNTILYCDDVKEEAEEYESDCSQDSDANAMEGEAAASQTSYIDCGKFIKVELLEEVDDEILSQPLIFD